MSNWEQITLSPREFLYEWKNWGLKVASQNYLISFTKWVIGAKRIQITYFKKKAR